MKFLIDIDDREVQRGNVVFADTAGNLYKIVRVEKNPKDVKEDET